MVAAGTVVSLHRWPVKSLAGEPVDALRIDARGAGGDRAQALFGIFGGERRRLTVRQVPRMLKWSAAYPQAPGAVTTGSGGASGSRSAPGACG